MQNEQVLKAAVERSADWQQAVEDFIEATTQLGQPFTSGHVTTILRVYRPEFVFKQEWIGEKCQDLFYNGQIVYNGTPAVQVTRTCVGLGRTPAGQPVFTYAAEQDEAEDFPFELDIPKPGAGLTQMPQEHPIQPNAQVPAKPPSPADMKATVHADHRLCVPRAALEGLLHALGRPFRAGDKVWVRFEGPEPDYDKAVLALEQVTGAVDYDVSQTRGRVLFPKAGSGQFNHGDVFACEIENDELVVDITKPL